MVLSYSIPRRPPHALSRHCFSAEAKSEAALFEYQRYHDSIFPEVVSGLRAAGLAKLIIFRVPTTLRLVMTVETAGPIDLDKAIGPGSAYREENPRCKEWEELMEGDLLAAPGWVRCEEILCGEDKHVIYR